MIEINNSRRLYQLRANFKIRNKRKERKAVKAVKLDFPFTVKVEMKKSIKDNNTRDPSNILKLSFK